MILFIVELFASVIRFSFYIKPSSGQLICDIVSFELYSILFFKMKQKNEKAFNILFLLMALFLNHEM